VEWPTSEVVGVAVRHRAGRCPWSARAPGTAATRHLRQAAGRPPWPDPACARRRSRRWCTRSLSVLPGARNVGSGW